MTIPSANSRSGPYTGNGVTTVFNYTFRIVNKAHLNVVVADTNGVETTLVVDSDYTVNNVGSSSGSITLSSPLPTGHKLIIIRDVPFTQTVDLENQGAYYAEVVEAAFDLAAMRDQQLQEQVNRAVLIPPTADAGELQSLLGYIVSLGSRLTELDTIANIAGNITTVAGISSQVANISSISAEIVIVAGVQSAVTTVAGNTANVNTVATNITNVNTVSGIAAAVSTVSGISTAVSAVAANATNINAAKANEANINTVAGAIANVNAVGTNISNVNAVAGNATNINTVAGKATDITTVAGISANVTSVAGISTAVSGVWSIATEIGAVYANMSDINNALANATAAINARGGAEAARDLAYLWANEAEDVDVQGGEFSAFHWAQKAKTWVTGVVSIEGVSGSLTMESFGGVSYAKAQSLTSAQKSRARANIGGDLLRGMRNKIINGTFEFGCRALSFAAASSSRYTLDRWYQDTVGSTMAVSRTTLGVGTSESLGGGATYCASITVAAGAGAGDRARLIQRIESVRTLAGKEVTVSFFARSNSGTPSMAINFTQNFGTGGSPSAAVVATGQKVGLTTEWQYFKLKFNIPSIAGKTIGTGGNDFLALDLWFDAGSTYNGQTDSLGHQSNQFFITKVQVAEGDLTAEPDPFEERLSAVEQTLCERYAERLAGVFKFVKPTANAEGWFSAIPYRTTKRSAASFTNVTPLNATNATGDFANNEVVDLQTTSFLYVVTTTASPAGTNCRADWLAIADAEL